MFGHTKLDTPKKLIDSQYTVRNVRGSKYLSPSSIEGCSRALYYHLKMIPAKSVTPISLQRLFDRGNYSEELLASHIEKSGMLVARQIDLYNDDPPIHGKIDFLFIFEGELGIIEHTTKEYYAFQNLHAAPPNKFKQWNLYSGLTGIKTGYVTVDGGLSTSPKWFPVTFDECQFSIDLEKLLAVQKAVKEDTPPTPEEQFVFGSEACLRCPYFSLCYPKD